jgi:GntR family transcriptional repressor for pyruvate dehydrogenase complex
MTLKTIRKRSFRHGRLSHQVLQQIENMIDESFQAGALLPTERELAERFSVSRIVIREAMKILEDRGVVEVRAGRGTIVIPPNSNRMKGSLFRLLRTSRSPALLEMSQLLELRQILEENAAGLAAVRATKEDIAEIQTAWESMRDGTVPEAIYTADLRFHRAIAHAAGNPFFEIVLEPLTEVFLKQIQLTGTVTVGVNRHYEVLKAIELHDPIAARVAVRRLMKFTQKDIRTALVSSGKLASREKSEQ